MLYDKLTCVRQCPPDYITYKDEQLCGEIC